MRYDVKYAIWYRREQHPFVLCDTLHEAEVLLSRKDKSDAKDYQIDILYATKKKLDNQSRV